MGTVRNGTRRGGKNCATVPVAVNNGAIHVLAMARRSIALFLATAGLMAGTVGCAKAPEPGDGGEAGEEGSGLTTPAPGTMQKRGEPGEEGAAGEEEKEGEGGEGGEDGEGGES
jgi:hypothetical protein